MLCLRAQAAPLFVPEVRCVNKEQEGKMDQTATEYFQHFFLKAVIHIPPENGFDISYSMLKKKKSQSVSRSDWART